MRGCSIPCGGKFHCRDRLKLLYNGVKIGLSFGVCCGWLGPFSSFLSVLPLFIPVQQETPSPFFINGAHDASTHVTLTRTLVVVTSFTIKRPFKHRLLLKSTICWDITLCSPLRVNGRFAGTYRLHLQGWKINRARNQSESNLCLPPTFMLVSCSAYSSALKMEAICSSGTSVDSQRTTRGYIPEDGTLHNHRCENRKSYIGYSRRTTRR
jgi:hypothetical protein